MFCLRDVGTLAKESCFLAITIVFEHPICFVWDYAGLPCLGELVIFHRLDEHFFFCGVTCSNGVERSLVGEPEPAQQ